MVDAWFALSKYLDKSFNITQGSYDDPVERVKAEALVKRIHSDILFGKFDPTLCSYKSSAFGASREQAKKSMQEALQTQKIEAEWFGKLWKKFLEV